MICSSQFLFYTFFFILFLRCHIWCHHVDILSSFNGIIFWLSSFFFLCVMKSRRHKWNFLQWPLLIMKNESLPFYSTISFDIIYNGYNVYHKKKKEVMKVIIFCGCTKNFLYSFWETEIFPFQLVQYILIQFFRPFV
jgi:hypothetical protein